MLNLTPHEIVVLNPEGEEVISFPASGTVARLSVSEKETGMIHFDGDNIPVITSSFGEVIGLPAYDELKGHERFLVSSMVLDQLDAKWANIAYAPDTGSTAIRNDKNHIMGVTRLRTVNNK